MKFYNRKSELEQLQLIRERSEQSSKMTILTGRRRIGKTRLIRHSLRDESYLYFFIARKNERLLCEEYVEQIKEVLKIPVFGKLERFKDIFHLLMKYAENQPLNLVIDEFQEFQRINPSIYSDFQDLWDTYKDNSQMNLILSGSVFSLMTKIFENSKEPLFGRANERLFITPFSIETQKEILSEINPTFDKEDLLSFYILGGGIPKYIEQFFDKKCGSKSLIFNEIFRNNSIFINEGKNVLIEEFGKEYSNYFSILSLIATGKTTRVSIESVLGKDIGGYLNRLEEDYQIIKRVRPIFSKPNTRNVRYYIRDNFLNFWFRFIYKNQGAIEIGNFNAVRQKVERDFSTFSGLFLERYFREQLALSKKYTQIGSYWEKGNKNEIDIIAINDMDKTALIAEVKIQKKHISIDDLRLKAFDLQRRLGGYQIEYKGFSLEDV
ncbi:MAG: ATP-binding protein [Bacteroidota bacterium]